MDNPGALACFKEDCRRVYQMTSGLAVKRCFDCYCTPGLHAMAVHRLGYWLRQQPILLRLLLEPVYLFLSHRIRSKWGIEIDRDAVIGGGCYIGHFGGITISGLAHIGRDFSLSQQVTIGISGKGGKEGVPTIGDSVYIAAGAKLHGKIRIGNNVKIGPNAVVYRDIPDNAVVVLTPGFSILSYHGNHPVSAACTQTPHADTFDPGYAQHVADR